MNRKALMMMANRNKGRRVNVEYEDWGARDQMDRDGSRYRDSDIGYGRSEYGGSGGRSEYGRSEYGDGYGGGANYGRAENGGGNYGPESRFRDRRGREHYDNGRYAPMNRMEGYPRYPDSMDGYDTPEMGSRYYHPTYPSYENEGMERRMNPIGFISNTGNSDATMPQYQEMERMQGQKPMQGYASGEHMPRFDRQMAEEWMKGMENEDGTRGPHWTMEQAKQVMEQKNIDCSLPEFWATMNMMYSDYCKVAKKLGVNTVDFYACMAEAFLNDKDAVGGGGREKLARYYEYVTQH